MVGPVAPMHGLGALPGQLASLLPAAVLGLGLFGLFLAHRERTAGGEVLAAWTFAAATLRSRSSGCIDVRSKNITISL